MPHPVYLDTSHAMATYLICLVPILAYILLLRLFDSFRLIRWGVLSAAILAGMAACVAVVAAGYVMQRQALTAAESVWLFPLLEEAMKAAVALILIRRRNIVFFVEALVYGAAAGGGFALAENLIYVICNPGMMLGTALFRGISTAMLHIGCTALAASLILLYKNMYHGGRRPTIVQNILCCMAAALVVAIHLVFNLHLLPPLLQLVATVLIFLSLFVALGTYNESCIYRWLDHSITFDIQLLTAIRQGRLTETNTGEYLLTVRSQFPAEVFFDIICFMQLYLELVISGKSRMMLQQAGLDTPLTADERQRHADMVKELYALRENIGVMGEIVLRPILRLKDDDMRIIG